MTKTIWAINNANPGSNRLEELLCDEWEPFAVTREFQTDTCRVWLRKIVRVEVNNDTK